MISKWFYKNKEVTLILTGILIFSIILIIGFVFFPTVFYDNWIWKYYWGPVVADSHGGVAEFNGVVAKEGYTIVSEITYGIILVIAIYFIYKLLKKLEINVDYKFTLALMPFIIFGSTARVLEDTGYFKPPLVYWFISPLIYFQIAAYALLFLLIGYYFERKLNFKRLTINKTIFIGGLLFLIPSIVLIATWLLGYRWSETSGIKLEVFLIVIAIVSFITILVYVSSNFLGKIKKEIFVYREPLNIAMLFSHLLDGLTTYVCIKDPLSMGLAYAEKHPASNILLETWGPLFPITKFLLILLMIYIFDILYKEELSKYNRLVNLLKLGIIILGLSPGLRDLLRATIGV